MLTIGKSCRHSRYPCNLPLSLSAKRKENTGEVDWLDRKLEIHDYHTRNEIARSPIHRCANSAFAGNARESISRHARVLSVSLGLSRAREN